MCTHVMCVYGPMTQGPSCSSPISCLRRFCLSTWTLPSRRKPVVLNASCPFCDGVPDWSTSIQVVPSVLSRTGLSQPCSTHCASVNVAQDSLGFFGNQELGKVIDVGQASFPSEKESYRRLHWWSYNRAWMFSELGCSLCPKVALSPLKQL